MGTVYGTHVVQTIIGLDTLVGCAILIAVEPSRVNDSGRIWFQIGSGRAVIGPGRNLGRWTIEGTIVVQTAIGPGRKLGTVNRGTKVVQPVVESRMTWFERVSRTSVGEQAIGPERSLVHPWFIGPAFAFDLDPDRDGSGRRKGIATGTRGASQRRSDRWVDVLVVLNVDLASRDNHLPLYVITLAPFVIDKLLFIAVPVSSEQTLVAVVIGIGNNGNILLDGDRLCNQVDSVLFSKHIEDIADGLFQKVSLGFGKWLGWIETNEGEGTIGGWISKSLKS